MYSLKELGEAQRDALMFWIQDLIDKTTDEIWILKCKSGKDGLTMDNIPQHLLTQETRRESFEAAKPDAAIRRRVILEMLTENGGMTAREVSGELHRRGITPTDERNYAAPRLTELYKAGKIRTTGKKLCPQTGRNVAVWAVRR
jgi:hypothetical protein